jgi:glucosamine--fructose-6-phosphate aminotransferase (isomerizing)
MSKERRLPSLMLEEAREAPARVAALLAADGDRYEALAARLRRAPPRFALTIARGSSDHAATYAATLMALEAGIATASLPPSTITRYRAKLRLDGALALAISQSGAGPDLVMTLEAAAAAGALTVALVNDVTAPLARAAAFVLDQRAGPERSVAATKSFIASLAATARLVALWRRDPGLLAALERLPERLEAALAVDWSQGLAVLAPAASLYVVGRGLGLGTAAESALKLKETSALHAEALSAAELRHGPRAVIEPGFPLLIYVLEDAAAADAAELALALIASGQTCLVVAARGIGGIRLPLPPPLHPLLDPIVAIQAFYPFAAALAEARGHDPDRPRGLRKVTRTL